ncbi:GNAT family N-acetyltransferase [Paenibacillus glacialis]|uniref:Acetyltransferase n=1 Tax=Paenibacillus glacialis TaxID=494026 RepID=A0A162MBL0_9BACL|nr:GNAT family N-acetyltransferase [Paenibacillus glacialis]OAB41673.1 acetyltransferase [Paenibacillus glacialis]
MSEIYRLATVEDIERLVYVTYEAYVTIRELDLKWPAAHADHDLIENNILKNECYVLEVDGEIKATVTLNKGNEIKFITDLPFIMWFAVDPAAQATGIGSKLLTWVEETIIRDKLGASAVTLATAEKHPWLLPMYERKGYERIKAFDSEKGDGTMHLLRKIVNPSGFEIYLQEKEIEKESEQEH